MAQTPPYASMKQSRDTLKLGSREMLKPASHTPERLLSKSR